MKPRYAVNMKPRYAVNMKPRYAVNMIVDSLPFIAASTAAAVVPRGAKMRFDWLTE